MEYNNFDWLDMFIEENDVLNTSSDIFTEEYIGTLPEIAEMIGHMNEVVDEINRNPMKVNPNNLPANKAFIKCVEKFFGLKELKLYWSPTAEPNAFTYASGLFSGTTSGFSKMRRIKGRGYYDPTHSTTWLVQINMGTVIHSGQTGREVVATLLHEFGHNMDSWMRGLTLIVRDWWIKIGAVILSKFKGSGVKDPTQWIADSLTRDDRAVGDATFASGDLSSAFAAQEAELRNAVNPTLYSLLGALFKGNKAVSSNDRDIMITRIVAALTTRSIVRKGEQWADSVATSYGLGADLMSGLQKMEASVYILRDRNSESTLDTILRNMNVLGCEIGIALFDEHGATQRRAVDCIRKLRHDLKKIESKDIRDEVYAQINDLQNIYSRIVNCEPEARSSIRRGFRRFMGKIFNITRIEDILPAHRM